MHEGKFVILLKYAYSLLSSLIRIAVGRQGRPPKLDSSVSTPWFCFSPFLMWWLLLLSASCEELPLRGQQP